MQQATPGRRGGAALGPRCPVASHCERTLRPARGTSVPAGRPALRSAPWKALLPTTPQPYGGAETSGVILEACSTGLFGTGTPPSLAPGPEPPSSNPRPCGANSSQEGRSRDLHFADDDIPMGGY
ncbi:hypothetical protein PAL_GLEAN10022904 [Pteropus alecto]|uniref:Uncharacterized protein n=1 Tax=Pteropus alecto TaxID=9402 RepID=L5K5D9_PTEAL|nr:hypothetical protein PAL_GLEAN10022904 [Pteropus alecto]